MALKVKVALCFALLIADLVIFVLGRGSWPATTKPPLSPVRQRAVAVQEMLLMPYLGSTLRVEMLQALLPPVGFMEVNAFPLSSPATQSVREGHETLNGVWKLPSVYWTFHALLVVGPVVARMRPPVLV